MAEKAIAVEERLDALYGEHPEGFVAGRDRLAKDLRASGDRSEADRIKKLRRPSVAAWLVNGTALASPDLLRELAEASRGLEEAQARALEGQEDAVGEWRAAAAREREASAAVLDAAEGLATEHGRPVNRRALELAAETLQAAAGDAGLRDRVTQGRLEREQSASTLGTPASPPAGKPDRGSAERREAAGARRELERLRGELEDAAARQHELSERVERTAETLRQERARLAEAKRATAGLRREVRKAERRAGG